MAQFAHDGAQGGGPFGYHSEWAPASANYGGGAEDNIYAQQAILNQSDNVLMQNFFDNPDAAAMNESFFPSFNWAGMDQKPGGDGFVGHLDGFDGDGQTIQNPAVTLGAMSSSQYQTHSNESRMHGLPNPGTSAFLGDQGGQASDDDVKAASYIYSLAHAQDGSRSAPTFGGSGGSWGSIGTNHPMLQDHAKSPLTSSGRQSASSLHSQSQHQPMASHPFQPAQSHAQIMQQHYLQQQLQNAQRSRHGSLQIDTASFHSHPQIHMPNSAHVYPQANRPPPPVRFGSDSNFAPYGYQAPNSHIPVEHEKGANLNNVPFAAQAAANGQPYVPGFTASAHQRAYHPYQIPSGSHSFQRSGASSSPLNIGGLPMRSSSSGMAPHGHPVAQVTHPDVDDEEVEDSDESVDFEETQSRKRRKGQLVRDDDAEYTPGSMKAPAQKRGAKAAGFDGSDDDDVYTPSTVKGSTKRRKSNAAGLQSASSSQSNSPIAMPSPTGVPTSSTKKKGRGSIARQNLTEDEKRRNHILSEKTRRDLIKVQYDQLDILVPALKNGKSGLSRSDILKEIVAYVEEVVAGNKEMERRLDDAKALEGGASGDD